MTRGLTKQRELEIEKRRATVAANVLAGLNYRDMASQLEVSLGTIANDVKIIAKRYRDEQISEYADIVQLELRRIDTALNAVWDGVRAGDKDSVLLMIALQNQRAKYLSLFEPDAKRVEILFPNLNANPEKLTSIDEIRRKRWEQVFPQLQEIIDVESSEVNNVTDAGDLSDSADGEIGSGGEPDTGVSADSTG